MFIATIRLLPVFAMLVSGVSLSHAVTITSRSPFIPGAGQDFIAAGPQQPMTLEWCGVMEINGELYFGLTEVEKQRSAWVKQNEAGQNYFVRGYTDAGPTLTVEYQGRNQTLILRTPKVGVSTQGSYTNVTNQMITSIPGAPQNVTGQEGVDARQMVAVAAEVRRRREMRAATTNPGNNLPVPAPLPPAPNGKP
jgi:hypothetical protein